MSSSEGGLRSVRIGSDERTGWSSDRPRRDGAPPPRGPRVSVRCRVLPPTDRQRYTPHVTLARLGRVPVGRVMDYLTDHALYGSVPFAVESFLLYASVLTSDGSVYRVEQEYPLRRDRATAEL